MTPVGTHLLIDVRFGDTDLGKDRKNTMDQMVNACMAAGATIISKSYHKFGGPDEGYTFIIGLAESHVSCHTWPEYGIACFDIFSCGRVLPGEIWEIFLANFLPGDIEIDDHVVASRGTNGTR